jgi:hypothetical protein
MRCVHRLRRFSVHRQVNEVLGIEEIWKYRWIGKLRRLDVYMRYGDLRYRRGT